MRIKHVLAVSMTSQQYQLEINGKTKKKEDENDYRIQN